MVSQQVVNYPVTEVDYHSFVEVLLEFLDDYSIDTTRAFFKTNGMNVLSKIPNPHKNLVFC